jgi:hypothetical protein
MKKLASKHLIHSGLVLGGIAFIASASFALTSLPSRTIKPNNLG